MNKRFTKLIAALALLVFMTPSLAGWGQTTYEQLTSIANIDESAQYVLGIDGTGFHYSGTSSWGLTALPSAQTPIYYTLTKATDGNSFTAQATISGTTYYLQIPTSNTFSMATSTGTNTDIIIGTTQVSGTNYAVANKTTTARHLRINGTSGLRSYAGTTGTMAFFYKVIQSSTPTINVNPTSINWNDSPINEELSQVITVSQMNLTGNITASTTIGNITWNTQNESATLTYTPTTEGDFSGTVTFANGETTATVAVIGSAYDPSNVTYYEKVASNLSNWSGEYIFTGINNSNYYALTGVNDNLGTVAQVTVTENGIQSTSITDSYVVTIAETTNGYSLYMDGVGYLSYSGTSNQLHSSETFAESRCEWTFSFGNGVATITNVASNTRMLQFNYNNGNPRFACYTSNQVKLTLFKLYNTNQVAMPAFNPAAGTYTQVQTVELSCATEGATIQYKLTENGDWQTYSSALTIDETTTVWAKATKEGMDDSDVASATYIIELPLSTIPAIFDVATSTSTNVNVTFGNWVVSGVKNSNVYVTDNSGNGFIIYKSNHGFAVNNKLSGTVYETPLVLYNGSAEFTNLTSSTEGLTVSTDGEITVITNKTIADLGGVNTGAVITLSNLTYDGTNLSDGTNTIKPYNTLYSDMSFTTGNTYNVTGVYLQYGDTKEILPRSADDIEELAITIPVINASNIEIEYDATEGEIEYNITNPVEGQSLTATSTAEWISGITVGESTVSFTCSANDGNADRSATITLSYTGATDKVVTVTQGHFVADYATLPFEFDGGRDDIANTAGLTQEYLGTDYTSSPKLKFNNDNNHISTLVLKFDERPGTLSFDIKGNSFSGGTFKVQTSEDGETYSDLATYSELSDIQSEKFSNLGANVRYIKWVYTEKSSGNVALGNIKLTKPYTLDVTGYDTSTGGYVLIASPVSTTPEAAGMITDDLGAQATPETATYDLYNYDQNAEDGLEWRNYRTQVFNLEPGTGYLYANKNDVTLTFTGTAYEGDGSFDLVPGWNLVGNPFAATAYISRNFYTMNTAGSELIACTTSNDPIEAMHAVFVEGGDEDQVTFSTTAPDAKSPIVALNVTKNRGTAIDRAIVRFDEGQQLPKFQLNPENTKLYIAQGDKDYAIVRSAAQGEMPVSFRASENGTYTIAVEAENVDMNYLHLIDNMTGADVDLLATPNYTFEARTNDYTSRFRLVFSANGIDEQTAETFAFFNGTSWTVSNTGDATLQVIDITGRIVSSETINGNATVSLNQPAGIYMLRLVNGNDVKVQKVVVR